MKLVNRSNLAIVECAATEARPGINGVRVSEQCTMATNGRCLIQVSYPPERIADFPDFGQPDPAEPLPDFTIDQETAKTLLKAMPKKMAMPVLEQALLFKSGEKLCAGVTNLRTHQVMQIEPTQDEFPDVSKVFPTDPPVIQFTMDANLFIEVLKQFANFRRGRREITKVTITLYGPEAPLLLERECLDQTMRALVLPMRSVQPDEPQAEGDDAHAETPSGEGAAADEPDAGSVEEPVPQTEQSAESVSGSGQADISRDALFEFEVIVRRAVEQSCRLARNFKTVKAGEVREGFK